MNIKFHKSTSSNHQITVHNEAAIPSLIELHDSLYFTLISYELLFFNIINLLLAGLNNVRQVLANSFSFLVLFSGPASSTKQQTNFGMNLQFVVCCFSFSYLIEPLLLVDWLKIYPEAKPNNNWIKAGLGNRITK